MKREDILKICKPGDLFDEEEAQCRQEYRELARRYHPDAPDGGDPEVFDWITNLYQKALKQIGEGVWEKSDFIQITTRAGKKLMICYLASFAFELGHCYVCRNKIIYLLREDKEKYYKNAVRRISSLSWADDGMKREMEGAVPILCSHGQAGNGAYFIVLDKPEDAVPLRLLLDYMKQIPGKHAAWMISRLGSMACYLNYSGLAHNGMDINSCFVSPKGHTILLGGGWWYTVGFGEKLIGTTKEIFDLMPAAEKTAKISGVTTDLESVKWIGRILLGEENSRKLKLRTEFPEAMADFLCGGSGKDAFTEMEKWDLALKRSYGERRFVKLDITPEMIYKSQGMGLNQQ